MASPRGQTRSRKNCVGSASVELTLAFPALMVLIFIAAQAGLYYYARSAALAAAQEGVRAGSISGVATNVARMEAETYLNRVARDLLQTPVISVHRTSTSTSVTITGTSLSVVPGFAGLKVDQQATAPIERVT